ncbi:MAG: fumarylacetoacetate hydrolase family protein [Spirochaetales bacterium]|nr:fumarylacetoacetate hydrolase family protein [Spirochaetales bacterium]
MKIGRAKLKNGSITWIYKDKADKNATWYKIQGDIFNEHSFTTEPAETDELLIPVIAPNIIAIGLNYGLHVRETGIKGGKEQQFFLKATSSLAKNGTPIVLPKAAPDSVDYEAELGIVIGKKAKNVRIEDADKYILGYIPANDVSARDCQFERDIQWARAKSFDTFCPVGDYIVTGINPLNLKIKCTVNEEVLQNSTTTDMVANVYELVSFLSKQMSLLPGTLILTGTPEGVGFKRKPPVFLREGDKVAVDIEGVGRVTNMVVKEK